MTVVKTLNCLILLAVISSVAPMPAKAQTDSPTLESVGQETWKTALALYLWSGVWFYDFVQNEKNLDKNKTKQVVISKLYLKRNGYTQAEINRILEDQQHISNALKTSGQKLSIAKNETLSSLRDKLEQLDPDVSRTYVNVVADIVGISQK